MQHFLITLCTLCTSLNLHFVGTSWHKDTSIERPFASLLHLFLWTLCKEVPALHCFAYVPQTEKRGLCWNHETMWDRSENPCSLRGVWQSCRVWEDCILHLTSDLLMLKLLSLRVTSKLSASTLSWAAEDIPCLPCWAFFSLKVIWALAAVIAMQLLAQWLAWRVRTQKGKSETLESMH